MEASAYLDDWRRHWPTVGAAMISMGVGVGLYQYLGSLFVSALEAEYGWTRGEISRGNALAFAGAITAPFIGRLVDRFGVARTAPLSAVALGLVFCGLALMDGSYWQFLALMLMLGCLAPATTSLVYSRPVVTRFSRHRGLALGVVTSGLSLSALVLAPVLSATIVRYGVEAGYGLLAALAFFIGAPTLALVLARQPGPAAQAAVALEGQDGSVYRHRLFWHLVAIMVLVNIPASGALTQLAPLLTDQGHAPAQVALLVSLFSASVLAGRLAIGWLVDRMSAKLVAASVTAFAALSCVLINQADGLTLTAIAIIGIGLMQGGESDFLGYFVSRHFQHRVYGQAYGGIFAASLVASAVGVLGFGRLYDTTGNYAAALNVCVGLLLAAGAGYLTLPARSADEL